MVLGVTAVNEWDPPLTTEKVYGCLRDLLESNEPHDLGG
jgi:hypothetical protein